MKEIVLKFQRQEDFDELMGEIKKAVIKENFKVEETNTQVIVDVIKAD